MSEHATRSHASRHADLPGAVAAHVAEHGLLRGVRRLGLAVSGGADSVALAHVLLPLCRAAGIEFHILHLNHGLRGRSSNADQRFVEHLAAALHANIAVAHATLLSPGHSGGRKGTASLEMRAREARLSFYRRCAADLRLDAIATAHQADDVAETLLLRLARGAGMTGLSGLKPRSVIRTTGFAPLILVRPLLACPRSELRSWLRRRGFAWREDASNRDTAIPRNHLRRIVLPWLEAHGMPSIRSQLARSADILRTEDEWLSAQANAALQALTGPRGSLRRSALSRLPLALRRRVVRQWLMAKGLSGDAAGFDAVEKFLQSAPRRKRAAVQAAHPPEPARPLIVPLPGSMTAGKVRITARLAPGIVRKQGQIGRLPAACSLDPSALAGRPLVLRYRRPGDRLAPLGMSGTRKLQDILLDAKVPAALRDSIPLLVSGEEIVWLPGYRVARTFAVRDPAAPAWQVRIASARRAT